MSGLGGFTYCVRPCQIRTQVMVLRYLLRWHLFWGCLPGISYVVNVSTQGFGIPCLMNEILKMHHCKWSHLAYKIFKFSAPKMLVNSWTFVSLFGGQYMVNSNIFPRESLKYLTSLSQHNWDKTSMMTMKMDLYLTNKQLIIAAMKQ